MYVFITYGFRGMWGVLLRGLRIAKHFNKKEVLFLHCGEDKLLKKTGYKYKKFEFESLISPKKIFLPKNTKKIIFCDLPSNRPFQVSILLAAKKKGIPVIIIENIYRRGQLEEKVYKNNLRLADSLILNGLAFFKKEKRSKTYIVPPLFSKPDPINNPKTEVYSKFKIPLKNEYILAFGYNEQALRIIKKVADALRNRYPKLSVVITGLYKRIVKKKNMIYTPYLSEKDLTNLIYYSKMILGKRGYLQILESLAFRKPIICLGDFKGFKDDWLDEKLKEVTPHFSDYNRKLMDHISFLLEASSARKKYLKKIEKLHDGSFNGDEKIAKIIRKTRFHPINIKPVSLISLALPEELKEVKKMIQKEDFLLPVLISIPYFYKYKCRQNDVNYDNIIPRKDLLRFGFNWTIHFGPHDYFSISQIYPWFDFLMSHLEKIIKESHKVYVIGNRTADFIRPLISKYKKKISIKRIRIKIPKNVLISFPCSSDDSSE